MQIINLVLTGLATLDSLGVLLNEDDGESVEASRQRHLLELTRVAKSSLFVEPRPSSKEGESESNPNQLTAAGS